MQATVAASQQPSEGDAIGKVRWQGRQWNDSAAPWIDYEQAIGGHPLHALQLMGSIAHYVNTRPVGWSASTADEAEYIRKALAVRPHMSGFVETTWRGES